MAKDIEKIIDDVDVPEMEYTKTKRRSISHEQDDVPEVVLPKSKAEMYEEAMDRLTQETTAASKAYGKTKTKSKSSKVKTVELESAVSAVAGAVSNEQKSAETRSAEEIKKRIGTLRKIVEAPKWVGSAEELVPFAWRAPLVDVSKPSKYYRTAMRAERSRTLLLPVPRDK